MKNDSKMHEMASLVERWVNINSYTGNLSGIENLLNEIKQAFQSLKPDEMRIVSLPNNRKGLFLKKRGSAPFQIFFGGHLDTVFSLEHSFQKATYVDELTLKGPGATDMKGGLVVMLKSLEQFERMEGCDKIGWEIFLNPDEEIGSPDSTLFIEECALRCHLACIFEPRLEDGSLVAKRNGSSNYIIISIGKTAHVGRNFGEGKNAIYPLARFIGEIESLNGPQFGAIINIGLIKGGEANNIIPDYAECHLNIRGQDLQTMQLTEQRISQLAENFGLKLRRTSFRPPKPFDKKTESFFQKLKECGSKLGLQLAWVDSGGVCDGNTFAAKGVPTIDTLGVRGGKIHTKNEYVHLESLCEQTELVTLFLSEIAKDMR